MSCGAVVVSPPLPLPRRAPFRRCCFAPRASPRWSRCAAVVTSTLSLMLLCPRRRRLAPHSPSSTQRGRHNRRTCCEACANPINAAVLRLDQRRFAIPPLQRLNSAVATHIWGCNACLGAVMHCFRPVWTKQELRGSRATSASPVLQAYAPRRSPAAPSVVFTATPPPTDYEKQAVRLA